MTMGVYEHVWIRLTVIIKKLTLTQLREMNKIERRIDQFETEQKDLAEKLSGEGQDYEGLNRALQVNQQKLSDYNMRWEAFAIELDELEREYAAERGK